MLHPSYSEIINAVNSEVEDGEQLVQSRYSIVIATAKRAREIISANKLGLKKKKALSIAIDEIYNQKVKIILGEDPDLIKKPEEVMHELHETELEENMDSSVGTLAESDAVEENFEEE